VNLIEIELRIRENRNAKLGESYTSILSTIFGAVLEDAIALHLG
jgi:hypothetical protein